MEKKNYIIKMACALLLFMSVMPGRAASALEDDLWFCYTFAGTYQQRPTANTAYRIFLESNEAEFIGFAYQDNISTLHVNSRDYELGTGGQSYMSLLENLLFNYGTNGDYGDEQYYNAYYYEWPSQHAWLEGYVDVGGYLHVVNGIFENISVKQLMFNGKSGVATFPVKRIGKRAFAGVQMRASYTVPSFITRIDGNAFSQCFNLEHLTLPPSFTSSGFYLVLDNYRDNTKGQGGICEGNTSLKRLTAPGNLSRRMCMWCTSLHTVVLQADNVYIPNNAFAYCSSLKSIDWSKVRGVSENAFYGSGIVQADLSRAEFVMSGAFGDCHNLESVKMGTSISVIQNSAFDGCDALRTIDCSEVPTPIFCQEKAFDEGTYERTILFVPAASYNAYRAHPVWGRFKHIVAGSPDTWVKYFDGAMLDNIYSTCQQAFNTQYIHRDNTRVELVCKVKQNHESNWEALLGGRLGDFCHDAFCFFSRTDGRDIPCFNRTGHEPRGEGFIYDKKIHLTCEGNTAMWYVHAAPDQKGSVTNTGTADGGKTPMFLFNLNTAGEEGGLRPDTSPCEMTLYECTIYEGDEVVRHFKPAQYKGVVGLFDEVTHTFSGSVTEVPFYANETVDAVEAPMTTQTEASDAWYRLDGSRLSGKPAQKGIYLNKGKKYVVR